MQLLATGKIQHDSNGEDEADVHRALSILEYLASGREGGSIEKENALIVQEQDVENRGMK